MKARDAALDAAFICVAFAVVLLVVAFIPFAIVLLSIDTFGLWGLITVPLWIYWYVFIDKYLSEE